MEHRGIDERLDHGWQLGIIGERGDGWQLRDRSRWQRRERYGR
jgi:hypothetical protein